MYWHLLYVPFSTLLLSPLLVILQPVSKHASCKAKHICVYGEIFWDIVSKLYHVMNVKWPVGYKILHWVTEVSQHCSLLLSMGLSPLCYLCKKENDKSTVRLCYILYTLFFEQLPFFKVTLLQCFSIRWRYNVASEVNSEDNLQVF